MKLECSCVVTPTERRFCEACQLVWNIQSEAWRESRRAVTHLHYGYDPWNETPPNADLI